MHLIHPIYLMSCSLLLARCCSWFREEYLVVSDTREFLIPPIPTIHQLEHYRGNWAPMSNGIGIEGIFLLRFQRLEKAGL